MCSRRSLNLLHVELKRGDQRANSDMLLKNPSMFKVVETVDYSSCNKVVGFANLGG